MSDNVEITNREIYDKVEALTVTMQGVPDTLHDHERRLRVLERLGWSAVGCLAVVNVILTMRAPW